MFTFEVSKTVLRAVPTLPDFKGDTSKYIQNLFYSSNTLDARQIERSLDEYYVKKYPKEVEQKIVLGGNPEYIEWCI